MGYLLLNFVGNSESGSKFNADFFNKPLKEQYDALAAKYAILKRYQYEHFIQACFNSICAKNYFISMPNFIRDSVDEQEVKYFNNIVIRAQNDETSRQVLPKGMEIILIGDVTMRYGEFVVKGIELIGSSGYRSGERQIKALTSCAFSNKTFSDRNGKIITVPEYGIRLENNSSVLTRDFMYEMSMRSYIVQNPIEVISTYQDWKKYVDFRKYYLEEQGKEGILFDECEAVKCFIASKRDYRYNPKKYDDYILDDIDDIKKDEQIVVTKNIEGTEPFSLMRVIVNKNKKELFADTVKNKGETPMFEQKIKRFTRNSITMESDDGKKRVSIDERYRLFTVDIEPNYTIVETDYSRDLKNINSEIDARYSAALKQQVVAFIEQKRAELEGIDNGELSIYTELLTANLETDTEENKDQTIIAEYRSLIEAKENAVKASADKMVKSYETQIAMARKTNDKKAREEKVSYLEKLLKEERQIFAEDIARQESCVSLKKLYENRNAKLIAKKESDLKTIREAKLKSIEDIKTKEFSQAQQSSKEQEQNNEKLVNSEKLAQEKANMKENQTIRRYYIYFKLLADNTVDRINEDIKKYKPCRFKYDDRAESAKIKRQELSLNNFFGGYVKSPFLSAYLFSPNELGEISGEKSDIDFFSARLNDKQKEAVIKAIESESVFLLQGPPGTGKTEVIAEIAAQFARQGKRILISSETHKAIDNVFDRLPKIPEIRPLRLIPSQSKKEMSPYSPEKLVDNFYINIGDRLDKEVERFKNFNKYKETFGEEYGKLVIENNKLKRESAKIQETEIALNRLKRERETLILKYDLEFDKLRILLEEKEEVQCALNNIGICKFDADDSNLAVVKNYCMSLIEKYPVFVQDINTTSNIFNVDINKIKNDIAEMMESSIMLELESKRNKIKAQMEVLRDPITDEVLENNKIKWSSLQKEYILLGEQIENLKKSGSIDISELSISEIVDKAHLGEILKPIFIDELLKLKGEIIDAITESKKLIGANLDDKTMQYNKQKEVVDDLKVELKDNDNSAGLEKENGGYDEYRAVESELRRKITEFFTKFNFVKQYEKIDDALDLIKAEWNVLERNYKEKESENKEKIPMYNSILNFLRELANDGSIEEDRKSYTKKLFENANVFGLTCTSRENFRADSMESFQKYNIEGLDVKRQGIDVVIIDEVSKSSFLDLLIPILYGKTVILVGDHRQLPPMYDLRNMRQDDFDGLDSNIINQNINNKYTALYEECFFKTLFESVPDRLRVTLTKQYRCHEDIMKVFNHFYAGGSGRGCLELGMANQNDQKQHGLLVKNKNGKTLIDRDKHIYFVDCGDSYEKFGDSTSATNEVEAKVITNLAKQIDEELGRNKSYLIDKVRGKDDRMSMGVICTYGDQAKLIKRKLKKDVLKNICSLADEKFIVSTVDDFQGDERDIIFVSMVRNPEPRNRARTRAEFVKKFERINVALSRARKLLVIVGAKEFLLEATIDLPDMSGNRVLDRNAYPIYREIIGTIAVYGLILKSSDVLTEVKD